MNQPSCKGCPYQTATAPGCCRGCPRLLPDIPAIPAFGEESFEPSPPASKTDLEAFLEEHPQPGTLRIQAFRGDQVYPVPDVHVTMTREFDGETKTFFQGKTNQSGIIDPILLPGAKPAETLDPEDARSTATYTVTATHPDFQALETVVDMFAGIKTIQRLPMRLELEVV